MIQERLDESELLVKNIQASAQCSWFISVTTFFYRGRVISKDLQNANFRFVICKIRFMDNLNRVTFQNELLSPPPFS